MCFKPCFWRLKVNVLNVLFVGFSHCFSGKQSGHLERSVLSGSLKWTLGSRRRESVQELFPAALKADILNEEAGKVFTTRKSGRSELDDGEFDHVAT